MPGGGTYGYNLVTWRRWKQHRSNRREDLSSRVLSGRVRTPEPLSIKPTKQQQQRRRRSLPSSRRIDGVKFLLLATREKLEQFLIGAKMNENGTTVILCFSIPLSSPCFSLSPLHTLFSLSPPDVTQLLSGSFTHHTHTHPNCL